MEKHLLEMNLQKSQKLITTATDYLKKNLVCWFIFFFNPLLPVVHTSVRAIASICSDSKGLKKATKPKKQVY